MGYSTDAADSLAKELHYYLKGIPIGRLRELGWFDFLGLDHPDATEPAQVACEAFLYLSIDDEGNWNRIHGILLAVVAYLTDKTGKTPIRSEFTRLKTVLESRPVATEDVRNWFAKVYR